MRIFVLGTGATGAFLAHLLTRQGHQVTCGDKDPERARRFLGKKNTLPVVQVNARNLWGIVRAARGQHLIVNASHAVLNEIVMRAALRLRAHYLDLSTHITRNPFKPEQFRYQDDFAAKNRAAVITAGVAPGLTNLLVARAAATLDAVEGVYIRLYESIESDDPISQWSAEGLYDEAISRPRVVRNGKFELAKRFGERERFRFPAPIGEVNVVLAAQDEVATIPHIIPVREMDAKIGGNEMDRLRRWYRQGKLHRSRGLIASRFPKTHSPRQVARLIRRGILQNARFAAAVIVRGTRGEQTVEIRSDVSFPTLYQIRQKGFTLTPVTYATARVAALFVKHFPREQSGVFAPCSLPVEIRRAILEDANRIGFRIASRSTSRPKIETDEEL
jgi:hypothetical protein